eukprot:COSAG04_NODE_1170_length_7960_cov_2.783743_6_plen_160_part_00
MRCSSGGVGGGVVWEWGDGVGVGGWGGSGQTAAVQAHLEGAPISTLSINADTSCDASSSPASSGPSATSSSTSFPASAAAARSRAMKGAGRAGTTTRSGALLAADADAIDRQTKASRRPAPIHQLPEPSWTHASSPPALAAAPGGPSNWPAESWQVNGS